MLKLVLAPGKSQHIQETIFASVPIQRVSHMVSAEHLAAMEADSVAGRFRIWAADKNPWAPAQWAKLERGDVVLFYREKYFRAWGRVGAKFENQQVGPELWPDRKSEGFPFLYLITGGGLLRISGNALNSKVHFTTPRHSDGLAVLSRITVLEESQLRRLLSEYGTIEIALSALSESPLIPFQQDQIVSGPTGSSRMADGSRQEADEARGTVEQPSEHVRRLIEREEQLALQQPEFVPASLEDARRHVLRSVAEREGQPQFRRRLLEAYGGRCAITSWSTAEALTAAHIVPYKGPAFNHVTNGLLLRADLHLLFDRRLITINPLSMTVEVNPRLDGSDYAALAQQPIRLPSDGSCWPSAEALRLHRTGGDLEVE
jgi:hypothetical protein